jgi:heat shock protein HslJ
MKTNRTRLVIAMCAIATASTALAQQQQGQRGANRQQEQQRREPPKLFPIGVSWTLVDINGRRPPAEATLRIDTTLRGNGFSGCNTFSAAIYPTRMQTLAAGPLAITKRACSPAVMQFERTYLSGIYSRPA